MSTYTYRQLQADLAKLNDHQLDMAARTIGTEHGANIARLWIADEDHINPSGDGIEPVSAYSESDFELEPVVIPKGTPLIEEMDTATDVGTLHRLKSLLRRLAVAHQADQSTRVSELIQSVCWNVGVQVPRPKNTGIKE